MRTSMGWNDKDKKLDKIDKLDKSMSTCISYFIIVLIYSFCSQYIVWNVVGVDLPWYIDLLLGLAVSSKVIGAAIVVFVVKHYILTSPFIHLN